MADSHTEQDSFNTHNFESDPSPSYKEEEPQSYYDAPSDLKNK